jgi:hypothetical protein
MLVNAGTDGMSEIFRAMKRMYWENMKVINADQVV